MDQWLHVGWDGGAVLCLPVCHHLPGEIETQTAREPGSYRAPGGHTVPENFQGALPTCVLPAKSGRGQLPEQHVQLQPGSTQVCGHLDSRCAAGVGGLRSSSARRVLVELQLYPSLPRGTYRWRMSPNPVTDLPAHFL